MLSNQQDGFGRVAMPRHVGRVDIEAWLQDIADSELSLKDYFARHKVPFSETSTIDTERELRRVVSGGLRINE